MKVIAKAPGYDGVALRNIGDVFDAPVGKDGKPLKSTWYDVKKSKTPVAEVEIESDEVPPGGEAPIA